MECKYRAFLSYSHDEDIKLAAALWSSLSRFAKPWYRLRTMRIFRDKNNLAASSALWPTIDQALAQSEYLVLLACPSSAKSPGVQHEVEWWLQNKPTGKLLIGLTGGEIVWDEKARDFDWEKTVALPHCLKGSFGGEPLYANFSVAKR
jgi:hypothetical protein